MDNVDLTQPVEVVNGAGRAQKATFWRERQDGNYEFVWSVDDYPHCGAFAPDGLAIANWDWRARNIIPAKPSTPSNEELTQRMEKARDEALALVRTMAGDSSIGKLFQEGEVVTYSSAHYERARSIVSDLPKPVDPIDPDLIEARAIAVHHALPGREGISAYAVSRGDADNLDCVKAIRAAIARGRTLASGGTAHE